MTTTTKKPSPPRPARPLLCSADEVRAILCGRKNQFRRIFRPENIQIKWVDRTGIHYSSGNPIPSGWYYETFAMRQGEMQTTSMGPFDPEAWLHYCPYGGVGDLLWCKETWGAKWNPDTATVSDLETERAYKANGDVAYRDYWRSSQTMPRTYSRLTLEITGVRVERVNAISEEDARAEGAPCEFRLSVRVGNVGCNENIPVSHRGGFANLWSSIHGADSWQVAPWVWAISFRRVVQEQQP